MESLSVLRRLFWITLLCPLDFCVSDDCTGPKPVIEPPHLVVKYGGPASATCTAPTDVGSMGWEAVEGAKMERNITQLVWSLTSITDWSLSTGVMCYTNGEHGQCLRDLPITIYKTPDDVDIAFPPPGPLREGQQYILGCEVQSVAPVDNLTVIWFRGDQEVGQSDSTQFLIEGDKSKAVIVMVNLTITASREDHKASYSCAAKLNLDTPEPIPDTKSNSTQLEVLYKPRVFNTSGNVTINAGDKLKLTCGADANPRPSYQWKHNRVALANKDSDSDTLLIEAVTEASGGIYECVVKNARGQDSALMTVKVESSGTPGGVTAGIVITVLVLLGIFAAAVWWYKRP